MSDEIFNEIAKGALPSDFADENSKTSHSNVNNSESSHDSPKNSEEKVSKTVKPPKATIIFNQPEENENEILCKNDIKTVGVLATSEFKDETKSVLAHQQLKIQNMGVTNDDMKMDTFLEHNKSELLKFTDMGRVVQNKVSASLIYLQDYNSDGDSSGSETDYDYDMHGMQFQDLKDESEENSEEEEYDSIDDLYVDGPPSASNASETSKEKNEGTNLPWTSELDVSESSLELPDISTLELNNKEEFQHIGIIDCILDKFVTIEGLPALPAYDLDTLFFIEEGQKTLGYIFDVMGPVASPIYVVNLKSVETVKDLDLKKGTKIYCAPKSKYTKYVFLHELMKVRGSDASWIGDIEVPVEFQEFSDDEDERQKIASKNNPTKRKHSLERHQQFEANMNKINHLNSRLHNVSVSRNPPRHHANNPQLRFPRRPATSTPGGGNGKTQLHSNWTYDIPELPYDGAQSLNTYFRNCTSQFLQHWTWNPASRVPAPQHFRMQGQFNMQPSMLYPTANDYVPEFDPSTPPPTYRDPRMGYYPSLANPHIFSGPRVDPFNRPLDTTNVTGAFFLPNNQSSRPINSNSSQRRRNGGPSFGQSSRPGPSNDNYPLND